MNKTAIKSFAIEARKKLISEITYRAGLVGINKDGISEPIHKASGIEMYDIGGNEPYTIKGEEIAQRNSLASKVRDKGFENVIEEVAYTWFNRIIAIRFMEVNDYLPARVRVLSSENKDKIEPDIVTEAPNVDLGFTSAEIDEILQLKQDNELDELFRLLFIKQCNALNDILPELFEKTSDYTELLLSISFTNEDSIVRELVRSIEEEDFRAQVEIIGWLYQYYNTDPKAKVDVYVKKGIKVIKEDVPAKTQLFTPDWVVRYMVENSLGKLWIEGHPDSNIKDNWKYYLEEVEQEQCVKIQLDKIIDESEKIKLEEIKFIDPSMGSGHVLVYAFDVFMDIYKSYGYSEREATKLILQKNLYGLDIDDRAYQLAYFAVMMKARGYARRILNEGIKPQICSIQESNNLSEELIEFFAGGNEQILSDIKYIVNIFNDAKEYGSILKVDKLDFETLYQRADTLLLSETEDFFGIINKKEITNRLMPLIKQAQIMSRSYEVVVTNPPYMGNRNMSVKLSNHVKKYFPNSKVDMFAIFIEVCRSLTKHNGFYGMITQPSILFLSSFEKLRSKLIREQTILNLLHMGRGIFGVDFGSTAFVMRNIYIDDYVGCYFRLHERTFQYIDPYDIENLFINAKENHNYSFNFSKYVTNEEVDEIEDDYDSNKELIIYFENCQNNFAKISGMPIAYWISDKMREAFNSKVCIADIASPKVGLQTGDNDRFLRVWYEINHEKIGYNIKSCDEAIDSKFKWFPYNKGGAFRRWYGNREYVVNWENDGFEIKNFKDENGKVRSRPQNTQYYFKPSITWSDITSTSFSGRYCEYGFIFDVKGSSGFPAESDIFYVLGFLNSDLSQKFIKILNPTITTQVGDMARIPVIFNEDKKIQVETLVKENIAISKTDWDSFETSWEFKKHPLIINNTNADYGIGLSSYQYKVKNAFDYWNDSTIQNFLRLKANEEELNRIFIEIYGLQVELIAEVEDENVTIRRADLGRDIRSFVSYAVGCMFGRYSLDNDGLVYAGGEWDASKYKTFIPDKDNIIPITDDEYFTDDIVGRFVEFVKVTYDEDTLEENLDFIAKALGNKGDTSRQIIRNYFIKDFYKDHVKTYQKKPIYWMFDSGKENGFKALIYMHRYNEDTVALVRADYLHKVQKAIENAIESADIIIDSATSPAQKAKAVKQKEKLVKQLAETRNYDAAIAHVASKRIGIDLDDGVTVNYAKFQGVEVSREGKKAVKIDLLSKI